MKAIILAGGFGTRMKGQRVPKPLVKVGKLSLIDHIIKQLFQSGIVDEIIISLGHRATEVRKYLNNYPKYLRDRFQYVIERKSLGTGGAIRRALSYVEDPNEHIVVINGDIFSDLSPASIFAQHRALDASKPYCATLAAVEVSDISDLGHLNYDSSTWKIRTFSEKTGQKCPGVINAGWYVFNKSTFEHYAPKTDVFSIENDVFPHLASAGRLRLYPHKGIWSNVGTPEILARICSEYA